MKQQGRKLFKSVALILGLAIATCSTTNASTPTNSISAAKIIAPEISCGVCGMYPARYPKWQTQIIFQDDQMVPFDSCKDMFKYLLMMPRFTSEHTAKDVSAIWVKDFNSGEWLNAKEAFFVVGSDAMEPMGKDLVPFAKKEAAIAFQEKHQGKVHPFSEINSDIIKSLGMNTGGRKMKMGGGKMMLH